MSNSNERKSQTLGMPFGTACNRLRKNILFLLLMKLKENICFKCENSIDSVDELSIEHKQPWEGKSAELFWDLENIAFSHLHCNRPNRQFRKYTPEQAVIIKREQVAQYMRNAYSTERRREKYERTGH